MGGPVELREAAAAFRRDGGTCPIEPLGEGNINSTYLVLSSTGRFVLQKINAGVFPEPRRVIDNFALVAEHFKKKRQEGGADFLIAEPVRTLTGELSHRDGRGGCWRGQTYLPAAPADNSSAGDRIVRAGRILGRFHLLAADLDVAKLAQPLPGFHHLPGYLADLDRLAANDPQEIGASRYCRETVERVRPMTNLLEEARDAGTLRVQPIHGDPKIDNFIFSGAGDGMLDLDTVGGGLIHYDLGDCLRSCCNRAGERGDDPAFDLTCCRALLEGYFAGGAILTELQRNLIFEAVYLITFELGVRFFTDHLRGNTYFRVKDAGENLARAVRQFRLAEDIAAKERDIRSIVSEAANLHPPVLSSDANTPQEGIVP